MTIPLHKRNYVDNARVPARDADLVEAYACRWNVVTVAGDADGLPALWTFAPHCLDDDLSARTAETIPVQAGHERLFYLGHCVEVEADDVGLRTVAAYFAPPLGPQYVAQIRRGDYTAYSAHITVYESRIIGYRGSLPVQECLRGTLREVGPTRDPADPEARILSVGGVPLEERSYVTADELLTMSRASGRRR